MNPAIDKIYMVNNFQLGQVHRPIEMIASAGGKGLNVARVARLLGEEVGATGPLGGGNGAYVEKKIIELNIKPMFIYTQGETRICINVTDVITQQSTEVLEDGPVLTQEEGELFLQEFESMMPSIDLITISGSLPQGLGNDYYAKLIVIGKRHGKKVLLDTSGAAFSEGIKALPYLIKPNEDEISKVYDGPITTIEDMILAIQYFKNLGIQIPIISLGKDGSLAGLQEGIYKVRIPPVNVVNTVGSGDAFIAGCAVALERGFSEVDMIRMATACGTVNTQYAHTGYVEADLVSAYYEQVIVTKVADYKKGEY